MKTITIVDGKALPVATALVSQSGQQTKNTEELPCADYLNDLNHFIDNFLSHDFKGKLQQVAKDWRVSQILVELEAMDNQAPSNVGDTRGVSSGGSPSTNSASWFAIFSSTSRQTAPTPGGEQPSNVL